MSSRRAKKLLGRGLNLDDIANEVQKPPDESKYDGQDGSAHVSANFNAHEQAPNVSKAAVKRKHSVFRAPASNSSSALGFFHMRPTYHMGTKYKLKVKKKKKRKKKKACCYEGGGKVASACGCASGGEVDWAPHGTDTVPAMLTPGEYVLKKSAVKRVGVEKLNAVNSGTARHFNHGGFVESSDSESAYDDMMTTHR